MKKKNRETALNWLVIASLFFYGWWNPVYLLLIIISICINFGLGELIFSCQQDQKKQAVKFFLLLGIVLNLSILGYFKYAYFLVDSINLYTGANFTLNKIILPLAISFFTFQQIAYLIDASRGLTQEYQFSHYALFVTFFPQLIAGPIVHHKEMLCQFMDKKNKQIEIENIVIGISIFSFGLFKKAVLADGIGSYANPIFETNAGTDPLTFFVAWGGALAYTFQLYYDFSGYSDMAIGASRLFGIKLPLNFHSPYKATSIIEFWRRWHITLSRFLRDYLYFALGGNKKGKVRRYGNLFITMLLGGLWHGAGWTFIFWGALHGSYLVINHLWRNLELIKVIPHSISFKFWKGLSWVCTFIAIVVGWVFFRAIDIDSAIVILKGMFGYNGVSIPNAITARLGYWAELFNQWGIRSTLGGGTDFIFNYFWIIFLSIITLMFPNTQQIMKLYEPVLNSYQGGKQESLNLDNFFTKNLVWKPTNKWSWSISFIGIIGVLALTEISEFLYFQF